MEKALLSEGKSHIINTIILKIHEVPHKLYFTVSYSAKI